MLGSRIDIQLPGLHQVQSARSKRTSRAPSSLNNAQKFNSSDLVVMDSYVVTERAIRNGPIPLQLALEDNTNEGSVLPAQIVCRGCLRPRRDPHICHSVPKNPAAWERSRLSRSLYPAIEQPATWPRPEASEHPDPPRRCGLTRAVSRNPECLRFVRA